MKFHLVLTKKDTDIITFKNSVSPKTFGELVTKILSWCPKYTTLALVCQDL